MIVIAHDRGGYQTEIQTACVISLSEQRELFTHAAERGFGHEGEWWCHGYMAQSLKRLISKGFGLRARYLLAHRNHTFVEREIDACIQCRWSLPPGREHGPISANLGSKLGKVSYRTPSQMVGVYIDAHSNQDKFLLTVPAIHVS